MYNFPFILAILALTGQIPVHVEEGMENWVELAIPENQAGYERVLESTLQ